MLAFIAAPRGITQLYIYAPGTGEIRQVSLPMPGAASHPVWSPDSARLAFEVQANGNQYILDYNLQTREVLTLSTAMERPGEAVLSLNWSSDATIPALTWSIGSAGHVYSVWMQRVGVADNMGSVLLVGGDYPQALYSQNDRSGTGSWLLVASNAPQTLILLPLAGGVERFTASQPLSNVQASPDGLSIGYFANLASGSGTYHVLNTLTGMDRQIATGVLTDPAPAWSSDSSHIAYSTGTRILTLNAQKPGTGQMLKQQGRVTALSWSVTDPARLVLAQEGGQRGIYLLDTQHNTSLQLDKGIIQGPIQWTEIP
jgi:WD40 repeat protein